jgi:putative tricarboxylic transport membrane protein
VTPRHPRTAALPDRLLGLALVALAAGVVLHARGLQVPFAADPVGPSAFPIAVALVMAGCGIICILAPRVVWERAERSLPGLAATIAMAAYALLMPVIGFIPGTVLLCAAIALAFGGSPVQALLSGAVTAPGLWLLLDRLLDLPLPRGPLGI